MENGVFCSIRANAPFSIIFSNTYYFKGIKKRYNGLKGYTHGIQENYEHFAC